MNNYSKQTNSVNLHFMVLLQIKMPFISFFTISKKTPPFSLILITCYINFTFNYCFGKNLA